MITLTIPASDVQIGDKLLMVDEHELRNPFVILGTKDNWMGAEYMNIVLSAEIRYASERAGLVRVERIETDDERKQAWEKLSLSYLSGLTTYEGMYPYRYTNDARLLVTALYFLEHGEHAELDPDGEYATHVAEVAYESVPEEWFIIPC